MEEKDKKKRNNSSRKRNKLICLRFTEEEKTEYTLLCRQLGLSQTDAFVYLVREEMKRKGGQNEKCSIKTE